MLDCVSLSCLPCSVALNTIILPKLPVCWKPCAMSRFDFKPLTSCSILCLAFNPFVPAVLEFWKVGNFLSTAINQRGFTESRVRGLGSGIRSIGHSMLAQAVSLICSGCGSVCLQRRQDQLCYSQFVKGYQSRWSLHFAQRDRQRGNNSEPRSQGERRDVTMWRNTHAHVGCSCILVRGFKHG